MVSALLVFLSFLKKMGGREVRWTSGDGYLQPKHHTGTNLSGDGLSQTDRSSTVDSNHRL